MQISALLRHSTQQLTSRSDSPRLDAEILLAHCLNKPRSFVYTWPEYIPQQGQLDAYATLITQRISGQPVAYLTGHRDFWGLKLKVTAATLIPRPDTELLVETALQYCHRTVQQSDTPLTILDLGTGSGAIALALASELADATLIATDKSAAALKVAQENAREHQLQHIRFIESDWFSTVPAEPQFDLIVSNPPYIAAGDPHLMQGDVYFEPESALVAGHDGLADIRRLADGAKAFLKSGGTLMLEHGYNQALAVKAILRKNGYHGIYQRQDLAGNDRLSYGHM